MGLHNHAEKLYSGVKQVLTDHLIEMVRYIVVFEKKKVVFFFQLSL